MSVLFTATNEAFLDILLKLPSELFYRDGLLVSRVKVNKKHKIPPGLEVRSWDDFAHPEKIAFLNRARMGPPPSEAFVSSFHGCESAFLAISDRSCPQLTIWERKRMYYELLQYWHFFFTHKQTKFVLFNWMPHSGWDFIAYSVAKRLGIPVLYGEHTLLNDRFLLLDDYQTVEKVPVEFLANESRDTIIEHLDPNLWAAFNATSGALTVSRQNNQRVFESTSVFLYLQRCFLGPAARCVGRLTNPNAKTGSLLLTRRFPMEQPQNGARSYFRKLEYEGKLASLRRYYSRLAVRPDYSAPFVFYALHFQPEKTSTPQGGIFSDQVLAVKTLAAAVPKGWTIYVKEHPMQLGGGGTAAALFRSKCFYDSLKDTPGVQLVDINEDSGKLVEHAVFTSTLTGSSGWESLRKSKPCVVLGVPWYSPCNSCYLVKSTEQIQDAVDRISRKSKEDVELDLLKFLAFYSDRFIVGGVDCRMGNHTDASYEMLVDHVVGYLSRRIGKIVGFA